MPEPTRCGTDAQRHPDGSITAWSTRRPSERVTFDPDEIPELIALLRSLQRLGAQEADDA